MTGQMTVGQAKADEAKAEFLRGGDVSMASYVEDWGAVFRVHGRTA